MSLEICSNAGAFLCLCLTEGREPEIPSCGHLLKLDVPWIDICRGNGTVCIFSVMIKEMAEVQWQFLPQRILVHVEINDTGQGWVATQQMNYEHRKDWTGWVLCAYKLHFASYEYNHEYVISKLSDFSEHGQLHAIVLNCCWDCVGSAS